MRRLISRVRSPGHGHERDVALENGQSRGRRSRQRTASPRTDHTRHQHRVQGKYAPDKQLESVSLNAGFFLLVQTLKSVEGEESRSSPEELISATKPITHATAKAVVAAKSGRQEDMVVAANIGRKAVLDMVHKCRVRPGLVASSFTLLVEVILACARVETYDAISTST